MKTETIIFIAIVLVNGAIALWKKRKERAAAAAAARASAMTAMAAPLRQPAPARPVRRAPQVAQPVPGAPARPRPVPVTSVVVPPAAFRAGKGPALESTQPTAPRPAVAGAPETARRSSFAARALPAELRHAGPHGSGPHHSGPHPSRSRSGLADRLRAGFLFAEVFGDARWRAPLR
jgi:hypothetical protein